MKKLGLVLIVLILALTLAGCKCKHEETKLLNTAEATCTENGYTGDTVCVKCNETVQAGSVIEAVGHTPGEPVDAEEATCMKQGYSGDVYCDECDELIEEGTVTPYGEHIPEAERRYVREATCEEEGYTGDAYCGACGEMIDFGEFTPMVDHVQSSGPVNVREATCEEAGYTGDIACLVCGYVFEKGQEIPALPHTPGEYENVAEVTCSTDGYTGDTRCTVCKKKLEGEVIPKLGHTFENYVCTTCGVPEPGLYVEGEMVFTWEQLVTNGYVSVSGSSGAIVESIANSIYGDLVLSDQCRQIKKSKNLQIRSIYAPAVTTLDEYSFQDCSALEEAYLPSVLKIGYISFVNCSNLKHVDLGDSLTSMEMEAFSNCTSLESIELPDTLKTIDRSFNDCTALKEVKLPSGLKRIVYDSFQNCPALTSIELPEGLEEIGNFVFRGSGIEEFIVPSTVTSIGQMDKSPFVTVDLSKTSLTKVPTFSSSKNLVSIKLPSTLTEYTAAKIAGCPKLERLEIPQGINKLYTNTRVDLSKCESLTTVVWPASLLDGAELATAPNLTEILYMGNEMQWSMTVSKDMFPNATITFNYQPE